MLWTNPESLEFEKIEAEALKDGSPPRIQFSRLAACTPVVLKSLDECCRRLGARVVVRFFNFHKEEFDAEILCRLPSVRALYVDVAQARNLEFLGLLEHLEEFGIGVREGDYPQILQQPGIQAVNRLVLINNRRNNVDLAPLASFSKLAELTLCAHSRHIEVLGQLTGLRRLFLNHMSKSVRFPWVRSMAGLRDMTIFLGSRSDIEEVSHQNLERLRVDRVRGLEKVNLAAFPVLSHFHMEDQLKVQSLDLSPLRSTLRSMTVWNCKSFEHLLGIEAMSALEFLWIGKTNVNAEEVVPKLPACVRQATFGGYGKRRDDAIRSQIESRGVAPAGYIG